MLRHRYTFGDWVHSLQEAQRPIQDRNKDDIRLSLQWLPPALGLLLGDLHHGPQDSSHFHPGLPGLTEQASASADLARVLDLVHGPDFSQETLR
jgi:hypothetical protein